MNVGISFLQSKIARRFCLLFISCAFLPTVLLMMFSYSRVASQLEEQSIIRLKRETQAYGLGLFDRMIRIDNELKTVGRFFLSGSSDFNVLQDDHQAQLRNLFNGLIRYSPTSEPLTLFGEIPLADIRRVVTDVQLLKEKPFMVAIPRPGRPAQLLFGTNIRLKGEYAFTVIGDTRIDYLWGVGVAPVLPPATELNVYNKLGQNIMASGNGMRGDYRDLERDYISNDLKMFQYERNGEQYYGCFSNIFIESRFQQTGWTISVSQSQRTIMSSLEGFKTTFPFIILFFLLLILYLSFTFIRRGLEPLQQLYEGTRRIGQRDFSTKVEIASKDEFEDLGNAFNIMTSRLDQQFRTLGVLRDIDRSILSSLDRVEILTTTLQQMKEFFRSDVSVYLKNSDASENHVKYYVMKGRRREDPVIDYTVLDPDEKQLLFDNRGEIVVYDQKSGIPAVLGRLAGADYSTFATMPIHVEGRVNRVAILGWCDERELDPDEQGQARQIANQLAVALTNAGLVENMAKLAMGTIEALARTVDAKSRWTAGHSERVAVLAGRIARVLGFSEQDIETLTRGALLHDIGKIGIPLSILDKPERLTDEEYAEIKRHPEIGAKILEPIEAYQNILPIIIQHHEKFDGSGYPANLKGEAIDFRARILAVADVWDAVVSSRPYRDGWVEDRAKKLIVDGSGSHFDPRVVDAFLAVLAKG